MRLSIREERFQSLVGHARRACHRGNFLSWISSRSTSCVERCLTFTVHFINLTMFLANWCVCVLIIRTIDLAIGWPDFHSVPLCRPFRAERSGDTSNTRSRNRSSSTGWHFASAGALFRKCISGTTMHAQRRELGKLFARSWCVLPRDIHRCRNWRYL